MNKITGATVVRWMARIWGAFAVLAVMLFFAAAAAEGHIFGPLVSAPVLSTLLLTMLLGLVAAWRYELFGGLLTLSGYCLFKAYDGRFPSPDFFMFLAAPAVLFLLSWGLRLGQRASTGEPVPDTESEQT
jgi:hypothetical protein